jgi:hypothetical protein
VGDSRAEEARYLVGAEGPRRLQSAGQRFPIVAARIYPEPTVKVRLEFSPVYVRGEPARPPPLDGSESGLSQTKGNESWPHIDAAST